MTTACMYNKGNFVTHLLISKREGAILLKLDLMEHRIFCFDFVNYVILKCHVRFHDSYKMFIIF